MTKYENDGLKASTEVISINAGTTSKDLSTAATTSEVPTEVVGTPWSSIGWLVAKRTYARWKDDGSSEEWDEVVDRVLKGCREQLACGFNDEEEKRLRTYLLKLQGCVAGRFLWQLDSSTVNRLGLASLQNCGFVTVDKPEAFTWAFDMLMLGAGIGYNIQREHVYKLPAISQEFHIPKRVTDASADFIVPDTRRGWVELLRRTLESAFGVGQSLRNDGEVSYSTQLVRGKGAPIKGFGGVASGPEELCWGIGEIGKVIEGRRGKQLRPIDCLDIMNIIGAVVVSGNVRRSAQIALGDPDDLQFIQAKRWDLGPLPNWRANSNNSVVCNDINLLPEKFWETYEGNSEPIGLINLKLARSCGRLGETKYRDKKVSGCNPCGEQFLEDAETCCLAEVFLPNVTTRDELKDITQLLYRVCKHSLALKCHHVETEEVVHKNFRMGIGVTGYLQATEEQRGWLKDNYDSLREFDVEYSAKMGFPVSIKLSTIKPSGSLSLLPGVTPGCHPAFARYLIRRIRISSNNDLINVCREHGYHVEFQKNFDGSEDYNTCVVEFPFSYPEGTVLAKDLSAIDQLEVVKRLQKEWSDNSVSCTVYYTPEDLPKLREYLSENYNKSFKSLSFLPRADHGFLQAPLEEISKERYDELVAITRPITSAKAIVEFEGDLECSTGACPVK